MNPFSLNLQLRACSNILIIPQDLGVEVKNNLFTPFSLNIPKCKNKIMIKLLTPKQIMI